MLSSSKDTILIIGASGFIGRHIYTRLRDSYEVIGTYFSSYSQGLIHLDMTSQQIYDILPHEVLSRIRYAIICSAVGNMEACSKNKEKTFELNVTATLRLIDKLRAYGIRIIYVSTGAVFNGCCGFYKETDAVSPINEYGRQKSQVEAYIASNYPESFIVRLSKVLATNTQHNHLLNEWYQHVLQNKTLHCIEGEIFNATDVEDVACAILTALEIGLEGIYHIANPEAISRYDLALKFSSLLSSKSAVVERPAETFSFAEKRPLNTSLDSSLFIRRTGMRFKSVEEIITMFFSNLASRG